MLGPTLESGTWESGTLKSATLESGAIEWLIEMDLENLGKKNYTLSWKV